MALEEFLPAPMARITVAEPVTISLQDLLDLLTVLTFLSPLILNLD